MPKRNDAYIREQRNAVARGALTALLEKGLHGTTSREICLAAGISNGALYLHFPSRKAALVAAAELMQVMRRRDDLPESWSDYVDALPFGKPSSADAAKEFLLEMELVAVRARSKDAPEGVTAGYEATRLRIRTMLLHLKALDIISLPLGAEKTAELHWQMTYGSEFSLHMNPEGGPAATREAFVEGLQLTAGLVMPVLD
jgi:AcrR family transcriptional regulator